MDGTGTVACDVGPEVGSFLVPRARILSIDSLVGQRMAVSFGIEFYHGLVDSAVEVIRTVERLMCEVMPLQVAPENLDVVQLRRVFRQPLDREPVGALGKGCPRSARAARDALLVWIGPLSRTSTIGVIATPSLGP